MTSKDSLKSSSSSTETPKTSTTTTTTTTDTPAAQLKHRHSFEERYSSIINQQILETTINREVLQRQMEAFFPFSRSPSKERQDEKKTSTEVNKSMEENIDKDLKCLQKLETLDIADKEQT